MNALIRKEIRLLLPAWSPALILAVGPVWLFSATDLVHWENELAGIVCYVFAFATILPSIALFGQEFTLGTFSVLLAQPVPRRRLWQVKTGVLAVAVVCLLLAQVLSYWIRIHELPVRLPLWRIPALCAIFALVEFAGGLWTTLLCRQVAVAFSFTIVAPVVFVYATGELLKWVFRFTPPIPEWSFFALLAVYSIAGILWARLQFLRAQDMPWSGGTIPFPAWRRLLLGAPSTASKARRRPFRALIGKELRSHHVSLTIAGVLLLLHLAVLLLRKANYGPSQPDSPLHMVLEFWWVLWLMLPLLIGCPSVAEERKLGTLESQLCVPATRRMQSAVKFGLVLVLGVFIGGVMPWLLENAETLIGAPSTFVSASPEARFFLREPLAYICMISAWIAVISLYASTLARNTLLAFGTAMFFGFGLTTIVDWAISVSTDYRGEAFLGMPLIGWIGFPAIVSTLVWLACKNCRHLLVGWNIWFRNLLWLVASFAVAVVATTFVYHRTWELLMRLEPSHGPVQLSGSLRPRVCRPGNQIFFVLLPDGRLWTAKNYERRIWYQYYEGSELQTRYLLIPRGGTFIGTSNWVDIVCTYFEAVGVQSDGSLWQFSSQVHSGNTTLPQQNSANIAVVTKAERIGADSNWKKVVAGWDCFLALKQDGTLWGWGNNSDGQLGSGPNDFTKGPVRIGIDSDWSTIFSSDMSSIGVKRDGSVWQWGYFSSGPNGMEWNPHHPKPARWNLDGSDWVDVGGGSWFQLVLRRDGTLWAKGSLAGNLLGKAYDRRSTELVRVSRDSDWAGIAGDWRGWGGLVTIKRNGMLFYNFYDPVDTAPVPWRADVWEPSRYSDWIAANLDSYEFSYTFAALAADGTVSLWGHPVSEALGLSRLLGPTRKPLWSVNIFSEMKQ